MKVLIAASEVAPFAKTGGLADVAGSLPRALAALGHDVRVILPRYRCIRPDQFGLRTIASFTVPLASWKERGDVLEGALGDNVTAYFINKDVYFDRPELYRTIRGDYPDNAERFIFFSRAVPEVCRVLDYRPDVIHCNDWQTGLTPLYLRTFYRDNATLGGARTVFTIHNLGYQGIFWHWDMRLTGLGWDVFTPDGIEYWGNLNLLKAGLVYADALTTVSPTYSREIQTPEEGHGLDGVLRKRSHDLYGIVNGIDVSDWNPASDPLIAAPYSASRPAGKGACTAALRGELGLPAAAVPVIGMVTRLADQKGLDILVDALPRILSLGCQFVVLGNGEERYHRVLQEMTGRYGEQMRVILRYDDGLAHRMYAGSNIFLMPSRYEPCGLGQMHALRYGSVPVVRRTGGLADTVIDFNGHPGKGTGFLFDEYSPVALADSVHKAVKVFHTAAAWKKLVRNGMQQDFSWKHSAQEYVKVYKKVLEVGSSKR